jgi:hypothetical protein
MSIHVIEEEFEDAKGVIRIRKSKNSQRNGDHKKIESTNNDSIIINVAIYKYGFQIGFH